MRTSSRGVAAFGSALASSLVFAACTSLVGVSDITFTGDGGGIEGGTGPGRDGSPGGRDGGSRDGSGRDGGGLHTDGSPDASDAHCPSSGCKPFVVATARTPSGIAVGPNDVYWTDSIGGDGSGGTVMKAPVNGGAPVTLVPGQDTPYAITSDTVRVYWTNLGCTSCGDAGAPDASGSIVEANVDGSNVITLASMQDYPAAIAADSPVVYWATQDGTIRSVPIVSGATGDIVTVAAAGSPLGCATGIALCGSTLFWADPCDEVIYSVDTTMPNGLSPGMIEGSAPSGANPFAVACNDSPLPFWVNAGGSGVRGGVFAYSSGNGDGMQLSKQFQAQTSVPFGPGSVYPDAIVAVDNVNVYWADTAGGTVAEAPMNGGSVTTLASGQDHPFSIGLYPPGALVAARVYWVNRGSGTGSVMGVGL